jgi:hypothetical protein
MVFLWSRSGIIIASVGYIGLTRISEVSSLKNWWGETKGFASIGYNCRLSLASIIEGEEMNYNQGRIRESRINIKTKMEVESGSFRGSFLIFKIL